MEMISFAVQYLHSLSRPVDLEAMRNTFCKKSPLPPAMFAVITWLKMAAMDDVQVEGVYDEFRDDFVDGE